VTSGNVHDAKLMDRLIRDDDTAVYGDKGYASGAKKRVAIGGRSFNRLR
jgi:transposase, IS5 family